MVALFNDMMHKEIEVYVDDMIAKSRTEDEHLINLCKLFGRLWKYQLKLNPAKCTFGVKSGKLLGFIVSQKGIEIDPEKVKAILEMPEPRTEKQVQGFLGKLNYIARFISQLTPTCEPIFKLLRKNQAVLWNNDCQEAFKKIKQSLVNPPVLMLPVIGRPIFLYMTVLDESMGCVFGQHDDSGKKEQAIYYLSKKFTTCEMNYSMLERTCCAWVWASHRLRQYMLSHTTWLISKMDPVKYIFEKPALTGRIARCQLVYAILTRMSIHVAQVIADAIYLFAGMAPTRHSLDPEKSNRALGFPALITGLCQSFEAQVTPSKVIRPPITRAFIEKYCTPRQAQGDAPQGVGAPPPPRQADLAEPLGVERYLQHLVRQQAANHREQVQIHEYLYRFNHSQKRQGSTPFVCPTPEQFAAKVAWPGDWPDAQVGEEPVGSPSGMDEPRMDEDMTDLFDFLGGSEAT